MDLNAWRTLMSALDPWRSLVPEEVGALYVDRPDAPAKRLAARLRMTETPPGRASDFKVVVCGARGSGKSTELARLAWEVRDDFVPVTVDLGAALPEGTGTLTAVALLGAALERSILLWRHPDADLEEALREAPRPNSGRLAVRKAMSRFGVAADAFDRLVAIVAPVVSIAVPAAAVAVGALAQVTRASSSALAELRAQLAKAPLDRVVGPDRLDDARALVEAVNALADELTDLAGRPVLLIAEGLDKRTEVAEVQAVLQHVEFLRALRAPVALSGPINLRHDPRFSGAAGEFSLTMLHNVPVADRADVTRPEGVAVFRDLWDKRRLQAALPAGALTDEALVRAAIASTGLMRDLLTFLRDGAVQAYGRGATRIEAADVEAAIRDRRLRVQGYLNDSRIELLQRVSDKGTLPASPDADVLLFENIIVAHANGELWFRPHAVLTRWLHTLRAAARPLAPDDH